MLARDLLSLSTRMFTTRTMRTSLTIFGVGVGIGAVLFLVSLGYGLQNVILGRITTADSLLSVDVAPGSSGLIALDGQSIDSITALPNVVETARMKNYSAQLSLGDLTSDSTLRLIDPPFFRLDGIAASVGTLFTTDVGRPIVISSAVAKLFDRPPAAMIGQSVHLSLFEPITDANGNDDTRIAEEQEPFMVVGIIADDTTSFAYAPLRAVTAVTPASYDVLKVKAANESELAALRDTIINRGFLVSSLSDVISQARQIFRIVQIVLGFFGLIALGVSAIGMFNTMTIALLERINEIGIMRSVGVTKRDIQRLFLTESMIMGFLGGVTGVALGYLAGVLANFIINLLAKSLGGVALDLFYEPPWFVAFIIVFSTAIGFITGIFPSRRAANMDPLEALRYK